MLNILSLLVGVVGLVLAIIGIIPIISLINWIVFPIAVVGIALGVLSDSNSGRNLNILVAVLSGGRLLLTWGLF
ncbi:hypothetical protein [Stakelama tenebrarum]|uniref:DUF456 domain-containing protein n=1 Tax=Stakelama tenebrarum TaxID=2711215 RepID=A0A6G6Y8K9_9SPHN|nr:hypothetical protein [Sphingosinithalassobacter tenebrarum]QIG81137.1 hypothetical protein G5C33_16045 [Sphingosinithalassobacter tenebrarum]